MASSSASLYRVLLGILVNARFMLTLLAPSFASLSAISFPYVPALALTQELSYRLTAMQGPHRGTTC
jgi:hypothetical protein